MSSTPDPYLKELIINLFKIQLEELKSNGKSKDWICFGLKFATSALKLFGQKCAPELQRIIRIQMIVGFKSDKPSVIQKQSPITSYLSQMGNQSEYTVSLTELMNYLCLLFVRIKLQMPIPMIYIVSKVKSAHLTLMFTTGQCISEIIIANLHPLDKTLVSGDGWEKIKEIAKSAKLDKLQQWAERKIQGIKKEFQIENQKEKEKIFEEKEQQKVGNNSGFEVERKLKKRTIKKPRKTQKLQIKEEIKEKIKNTQQIHIPQPRKSLPRTLFQTNKYTFKSSRKKQSQPQIIYILDSQKTEEQHRIDSHNISQDDFSDNLNKLKMKTPPRKDKGNQNADNALAEDTPPRLTRKTKGFH